MKFRTEIEIPTTETQLTYSNKIFAIGSCFAASIGERLRDAKFTINVNPTGVLFNPLSICNSLKRFNKCQLVTASEVFEGREGWFHFDFHSSLNGLTQDEAVDKINHAIINAHNSLDECDTIIITLGTVWIYELIDGNKVVANCHKVTANKFKRRAMSVDEIVEVLSEITELYPSKHFIFTVSPIRHLADGLSENSLSKATLRVAVSQLVQRYNNVSYFPAYEIMVDDLRDYRFYAEDMVHPSNQAVDYIWSKFCESQFNEATNAKLIRILDIMRAAAHRPFNSNSKAHQEFCRKQLERIKELSDIDFGKESAYFEGQLQNNL